MKAGIVSASLLTTKKLRASDYLCPDDALEKTIGRLEKALASTTTGLANKKAELAERKEHEQQLVDEGLLTILPSDPP